jgi:hypothetical protein
MPTSSGKPLAIRPVIDATVPGLPTSPIKNISVEQRQKLEDGWNASAEKRRLDIERENITPTAATRVLRFELWQFGRLWNAYAFLGKRMIQLMPSPSILPSALQAAEDAMRDLAVTGKL